jgi:integrase
MEMPLFLKGSVKPGQPDRRYYMIRVQVDGRRAVTSSGTRVKSDAERKEQSLLEALRKNPQMSQAEIVEAVAGKGTFRHQRAVVKSDGVTVRQAFDTCLTAPQHWKQIKGFNDYRRAAAVVCEIMGDDLPLAAIDAKNLSELAKTLTEHPIERKNGTTVYRAGNTVNFYLAVLRSMLNIVATEAWPNAPHMYPKVPTVPKRDQREFYLTPETETLLLDELDKWDEVPTSKPEGRARKRDGYLYRELFLCLLEGGLRVNEGIRLRWPDVRFPPEGTGYDEAFQGNVTLYRAAELKRGKRRTVPMTPTMRRLLEGIRDRDGMTAEGPFSALKYKRANTMWVRARTAAGITDKDCVIHCTRHSCASRLLESGVGLYEVKEWLGHSTIATTEKYLHLAQHQLVGAAAKMSKLRGPL